MTYLVVRDDNLRHISFTVILNHLPLPVTPVELYTTSRVKRVNGMSDHTRAILLKPVRTIYVHSTVG